MADFRWQMVRDRIFEGWPWMFFRFPHVPAVPFEVLSDQYPRQAANQENFNG